MSLNVLTVVLSLFVLVVDISFGTFCDEGPPGRYCFKDLSGWYECKIDSKTQQMTETKHKCPVDTRCKCFYGPNCPSILSNPCGHYVLPPPFPVVFSTFYITTVTACNNKVCTNYTEIGELLQNGTNRAALMRHDRVGLDWETTFIFPFQYVENRDFLQFDVAWFEHNCSVRSRVTFPLFGVPHYFTCEKKPTATFMVCLWQSGGHSKTEEVVLEKWLLTDLPDGRFKPYFHEVQVKPSLASNRTTFYDTNYASFFEDFLDPSQLSMPSFCARDVTAQATAQVTGNPARGHKPAINRPKIGPEIIAEMKANGIVGFFEKFGSKNDL